MAFKKNDFNTIIEFQKLYRENKDKTVPQLARRFKVSYRTAYRLLYKFRKMSILVKNNKDLFYNE